MSQERTDAQLERWIGELEYFDSHPVMKITGMGRNHYGPGQAQIDYRVTAWLRREAAALKFRKMLYA